MDFQVITQEKYLQYFLCDCEHSISDTVMTEFLDDMITLSEQMDKTTPPTEIIKEIRKKSEIEGGLYDSVLSNTDLIETLNIIEVFTLLWYVSCRNTFTHEEAIYLNMANNKTIGNLLKRLAALCA